MTCCAGSIVADCAREKVSAGQAQLLADLKAGSRRLADGSINYIVSAPSINCGSCIAKIERKLGALEGVHAVRANLSLRRVSVTLDSDDRSPLAFIDVLESLGFPTQVLDRAESGTDDAELNTLLRALAVAGFAATNIMLLSVSVWSGAEGATREVFHYVSSLIAIPTVAYSGQPFFRSALAALRRRRLNMDVPISLGVILATGMSLYESVHGGGSAYFDAAVSLLFFLLIGRTLDHMMRAKAREAATSLGRLAAKGGFAVGEDGEVVYVPLDAIRPGMILRVSPGERFPVDGTVVAGVSDVDRSLVTGESAPLKAMAGSSLEAGTLSLTGSVDIRVTKLARDSFLADVMQMMQAAEEGRGHYVRLADRMAQIYSPAVHVLALTSFIAWMIFTGGDWHQSLTVAVAVLIITCPCALGLAVPVAHVVAASRLFSAGILMKDGSALERLAAINHAAFDKTGTLTTGEPTIRSSTIPRGRMSAIAKSLALRSIHPAARALARSISAPPLSSLNQLHEVPGHGVEAVIDGKRIRLGRPDWVAEIAGAEPSAAAPAGGVSFAVEGHPRFAATLSESLRAGAKDTITGLRADGIDCTILSGDNERQVASVARALADPEFHACLRPSEKLAYLNAAASRGDRVLMVGDGLNDAPALAAAHVSMAPSGASDIGRMAADFVFTRENLQAVSFAHFVAVAGGRIVKQNFAMAIVYNILAVPLAMAGMLNPLIAAIAMSTSSILVVGNSLRLHFLKPVETSQSGTESLPLAPNVERIAA